MIYHDMMFIIDFIVFPINASFSRLRILRENKNLRGRISKILTDLYRKLNFISKYMHILIFHALGGAIERVKNFAKIFLERHQVYKIPTYVYISK